MASMVSESIFLPLHSNDWVSSTTTQSVKVNRIRMPTKKVLKTSELLIQVHLQVFWVQGPKVKMAAKDAI